MSEKGSITGTKGTTYPRTKLAGKTSRWMGSIKISSVVGLMAEGEVISCRASQSGVIRAFE